MINWLHNIWRQTFGRVKITKGGITVSFLPLSGSGDQPPNPPTGGK